MSAAQNPQVQLLFEKSAEDEETLALPVPAAVFEFHTQQAIEKLLKALIAAHQQQFLFTHNLRLLLQQLDGLGESVPEFSLPLDDFTKFGVLVRYDRGEPLSQEQRDLFRRVVTAVRIFVRERVEALP